jgi:hypothetical protein
VQTVQTGAALTLSGRRRCCLSSPEGSRAGAFTGSSSVIFLPRSLRRHSTTTTTCHRIASVSSPYCTFHHFLHHLRPPPPRPIDREMMLQRSKRLCDGQPPRMPTRNPVMRPRCDRRPEDRQPDEVGSSAPSMLSIMTRRPPSTVLAGRCQCQYVVADFLSGRTSESFDLHLRFQGRLDPSSRACG